MFAPAPSSDVGLNLSHKLTDDCNASITEMCNVPDRSEKVLSTLEVTFAKGLQRSPKDLCWFSNPVVSVHPPTFLHTGIIVNPLRFVHHHVDALILGLKPSEFGHQLDDALRRQELTALLTAPTYKGACCRA